MHNLFVARRAWRGRVVVAALLICLIPYWVVALTPSDVAEVRNFTLTESFIKRCSAIGEDARRMHWTQNSGTDDDSAQSIARAKEALASVDAMVTHIHSTPGAESVIRSQGLSVREYVVGYLALLNVQAAVDMAPYLAKMQNDPRFAQAVKKSLESQPNDANIAFYREHKAEIQRVIASAKQEDD